MNLIPILNLKISKEKWKHTKLKYDNSTYQDVLNDICYYIYNWLIIQNDLYIITDFYIIVHT